MCSIKKFFLCAMMAVAPLMGNAKGDVVYCVGKQDNDLVRFLNSERFKVVRFDQLEPALQDIPSNSALIILNPAYPDGVRTLSESNVKLFKDKKLRVFAEYASISDTIPKPQQLNLERVVVTGQKFDGLHPMDILSINRSYILKESNSTPDLAVAKVAGFDKAEYGLEGTEVFPLLFKDARGIIRSTSQLSNFERCRFMPEMKWKLVWESIMSDLMGHAIKFKHWPIAVAPSYTKDESLPRSFKKKSVQKGVEWYFNGHFLVDASWRDAWVGRYQGDGTMPVGPSLPEDAADGDGTLGVLEGHCSAIYADGRQAYRYWMRDDVQGESSMTFALASKLLKNKKYADISANLVDYSFREFCDGPRNDPNSPTYGLLGWAITHKYVYYGDDNARSILGMLLAAEVLGNHKWDEQIARAIEANFKTTSKSGFRTDRIEDQDIQANGLKFYQNREVFNPHPHFESWLWACYLLYYQKTGKQEYYDLAERGIRKTMEAYPAQWLWSNGIQMERARMILPLAWLCRVSPNEEHSRWLNTMVDKLLEKQQPCGAIIEELGDPSKGVFGKERSNQAYGTNEAPLIFDNGDPVSDMLYTCNFAFFALNEASAATSDVRIKKATERLAAFMAKIQVKSSSIKNVDGAWFRAFNFQDWNYWASNADAGWGAQSTLTGWIQSWIVSTLALMEMKTSYWDIVFNK